MALLADPHEAPPKRYSGFPGLDRPIAEAARFDVLPGRGRAAVGPLLAFVRKPENAANRATVAQLLGKLGYDERSLAFLVEMANAGTLEERCVAVPALGRLGPEAVPALVRVGRDRGQNDVIRRSAIEETVRHGTAETAGAFLREALGYGEEQHRWAAADAIGSLGVRAALPDLRRHVADEGEKYAARYSALRAYMVLADPADVRELLRTLLGSKNPTVRGLAEAWPEWTDVPEGP